MPGPLLQHLALDAAPRIGHLRQGAARKAAGDRRAGGALVLGHGLQPHAQEWGRHLWPREHGPRRASSDGLLCRL
eukprot:2541906-Prymnesium_polylepis.1